MAFVRKLLPHDAELVIPAKAPAEMSVKELKAAIVAAGLQSKARGLFEKAEFVKLLDDHRQSQC